MATAWTGVAMSRLKTHLEDDATLSVYVDSVSLAVRLRDDEAPSFTRHAIVLAAGPVAIARHSTQSNMETFTIHARLWIRKWANATAAELLYGNDVSAGLGSNGSGGSKVGILQFVEDMANAIRGQGLSSLLETTAMEGGASSDFSAPREVLDDAFLVHDIDLPLERFGNHDATLRTPS